MQGDHIAGASGNGDVLKIVLTNDDGYGEPGLTVLADVVRPWGDVILVAPRLPQSGVGHRVTMRDPLKVQCVAPNHYVVDGTPADCTRLALKSLVPEARWVMAGINPGANLGSDVYQSGTVAAVREAAILGVKGIAVSQYIGPLRTVDWVAAGLHLSKLLPRVMQKPCTQGQFWNINLPSLLTTDAYATHQFCPLDKHPHRYSFAETGDGFQYQGVIHDRPYTAGSDVAVCFGGEISITCMEI